MPKTINFEIAIYLKNGSLQRLLMYGKFLDFNCELHAQEYAASMKFDIAYITITPFGESNADK